MVRSKRIFFFSFLIVLSLILMLSIPSCKREAAKETPPTPSEAIRPVETEVDIQKIESATGISFKILKTEVVGYMPLHKFFWVCIEGKPGKEVVEKVANAIISETISKKPKTYHSVSIHFYCEEEMKETLEMSKSFAKATFLPEGNWQKVGRVDIGDYQSYVLTCEFPR